MSETRWPSEEIPDEAVLFIRIHKVWFTKRGTIAPGFFKNRPDEKTGAMSTDWSRYSTPEVTRSRAKKPDENAVGRLVVGEVRHVPMQTVVHTPIQDDPTLPNNRAHTDVRGPKEDTDLDIQDQFSRICQVVLTLPDQGV